MPRNRCSSIFILMVAALVATGCDLLDPVRPTAQPDTELFGNLLETTPSPDNPGAFLVTVRVGVPRDLVRSETEAGATPPEVDKGITATVTVTEQTVVLGKGQFATVDDIDPGTEVVVIPVEGTTFMMGSNAINLDAAYLIDFTTYKNWRLPKLAAAEPTPERNDVNTINTDGAEVAPVPVAGGRVLYFSAHLRPPALADGAWQGAAREGLSEGSEEQPLTERSFRTELGDDGWSTPELVKLSDLDEAVSVRVSWVADDELTLLVTVTDSKNPPWVGQSQRSSTSKAWGEVERLERLGEDAADAVYLAGSRTKITFVSSRGSGQQADLLYCDLDTEDEPLPLEPKVNTVGHEWGPRVGVENELFFMRSDRQMMLASGNVTGLRLPGPHRIVFSQTAPTDDGKWVFLCIPSFLPVEFDQDIYVASLGPDGFGEPVPVDDWRPEN